MAEHNIADLGPLAVLAGVWEGQKGDDLAPDDTRKGIENNKFRERMEFEPIGRVDNHEQVLYGLRYKTMAWRIGVADPFHEEVGYMLWEPATGEVMKCFIVPRGVTVIAGGKVKPDAKAFTLKADLGSQTYGICSNKFLDKEFQTVQFDVTYMVLGPNQISYEEDTHLKIKGQDQIFHHRDSNTLTRVRTSLGSR